MTTIFAAWTIVERARKPLLFLVAALAALGVWAYLTAAQSVFPQISLSRIEVFANVGIPFVTVTANDLPKTMDHNLDMLQRHRTHLGTSEELLFLRHMLATNNFETLGGLVAVVGRVRALHALASGQIHFDHFEKVTDSSRLFSTLTEERDAARHLYAGI